MRLNTLLVTQSNPLNRADAARVRLGRGITFVLVVESRRRCFSWVGLAAGHVARAATSSFPQCLLDVYWDRAGRRRACGQLVELRSLDYDEPVVAIVHAFAASCASLASVPRSGIPAARFRSCGCRCSSSVPRAIFGVDIYAYDEPCLAGGERVSSGLSVIPLAIFIASALWRSWLERRFFGCARSRTRSPVAA